MKSEFCSMHPGRIPSLPSWERGLKSVCSVPSKSTAMVAPLVGAWIEIDRTTVEKPEKTSLPSWERGLKYTRKEECKTGTPVAPLVGAWIEITRFGRDH